MLQKRNASWHVQVLILGHRHGLDVYVRLLQRTDLLLSFHHALRLHELGIVVYVHLPLEQLVEAFHHGSERRGNAAVVRQAEKRVTRCEGRLVAQPNFEALRDRASSAYAI
jgi:hypothetical protein